MTHDTSNRLIVTGFAMAYFGAMGLLLMLSSVHIPENLLGTVRLVLAGLVAVGGLVALVGRLAPLRDS